ncbi:MAG: hypothetical protein K8R50_09900 [Betaproteobacteria bacterium]|nr:hypothetical protein [Betaproteobacteria bacterium]
MPTVSAQKNIGHLCENGQALWSIRPGRRSVGAEVALGRHAHCIRYLLPHLRRLLAGMTTPSAVEYQIHILQW